MADKRSRRKTAAPAEPVVAAKRAGCGGPAGKKQPLITGRAGTDVVQTSEVTARGVPQLVARVGS